MDCTNDFWLTCEDFMRDGALLPIVDLEEEEEHLPTKAGGKRKVNFTAEELRVRRNLRRRKDVNHFYIPRLDVRKRISAMFVNMINAWDFALLERFLKRYGRPDLSLVSYTNRLAPQGGTTPVLTLVKGSQSILQFATTFMNCTPDACLNLHETEIRMASERSTIISHLTFQGTVLFKPKPRAVDIRFRNLLEQGNTIGQSEEGLVAMGPQAAELESVIYQRSSALDGCWFTDLDALAAPIPYHNNGGMVIKMDDNDMIQSIDIVDAFSFIGDYYLPLKHAAYTQFKHTD